MYISNNNLSFKSTMIPLNSKKPIFKYMDALKNFNLVSVSEKTTEECYKSLFNQARNAGIYRTGVKLESNPKPCLRILGNDYGSDRAVFSALRKVDKNVKYNNDIPNDGYDHSAIELLV